MKVSVIIPTYNEKDSILDCLESLGKQTFEDLEIIVVDDGSVDGTPKLVENLVKVIPQIKLLRQKHKGAGTARSFGAKRAKGEILVFVDADMTFEPAFVKKLVEPIVKGKAIGTFSKEEYLANKNNLWARCWNINRGLPAHRMQPPDYPDTQKVFRAILKSEFAKAGGFDQTAGYTDDWSLAEKLGKEAIVAPGAKFYHRNPDNLAEVFVQSRWMAKRKYKLGPVGYLVGLIRVSLPFSLLVGLVKSVAFLLPAFLVFKVVSDFGQFIGILEYSLVGKVSK